jgi:hypothetical protein
MEVTVAIRHIGEVVTDVLSGAGDPDSDVVVGQKSGPVTGCPWVPIVRSGRQVSYGRVIPYRGGPWGGSIDCRCCGVVVDQRPETGLLNRIRHAGDAQVSIADLFSG